MPEAEAAEVQQTERERAVNEAVRDAVSKALTLSRARIVPLGYEIDGARANLARLEADYSAVQQSIDAWEAFLGEA